MEEHGEGDEDREEEVEGTEKENGHGGMSRGMQAFNIAGTEVPADMGGSVVVDAIPGFDDEYQYMDEDDLMEEHLRVTVNTNSGNFTGQLFGSRRTSRTSRTSGASIESTVSESL